MEIGRLYNAPTETPRGVPMGQPPEHYHYRKTNIPIALRREVWMRTNGKKFESKCFVSFCRNVINVFNFECGHDIPESKGGATTLDNLHPICSGCNRSMGNRYSIKEFGTKFGPPSHKRTGSIFSCWQPSAL